MVSRSDKLSKEIRELEEFVDQAVQRVGGSPDLREGSSSDGATPFIDSLCEIVHDKENPENSANKSVTV